MEELHTDYCCHLYIIDQNTEVCKPLLPDVCASWGLLYVHPCNEKACTHNTKCWNYIRAALHWNSSYYKAIPLLNYTFVIKLGFLWTEVLFDCVVRTSELFLLWFFVYNYHHLTPVTIRVTIIYRPGMGTLGAVCLLSFSANHLYNSSVMWCVHCSVLWMGALL
jgi:hypothetical protein